MENNNRKKKSKEDKQFKIKKKLQDKYKTADDIGLSLILIGLLYDESSTMTNKSIIKLYKFYCPAFLHF